MVCFSKYNYLLIIPPPYTLWRLSLNYVYSTISFPGLQSGFLFCYLTLTLPVTIRLLNKTENSFVKRGKIH